MGSSAAKKPGSARQGLDSMQNNGIYSNSHARSALIEKTR